MNADKTSLYKEWKFENFETAVDFFLKVAEIAKRHNHHPEFLSSHTKVRIRLSTHDVGGLTQKDFDFALAVDQLVKSSLTNL